MEGETQKKQKSGTLILTAVVLGIVNILLVAGCVFLLLMGDVKAGKTETALPKDFRENRNEYYEDFNRDNAEVYTCLEGLTVGSDDYITPTPEPTPEPGADTEGFVFPNSDTELLTDEQLAEKLIDAETCRRSINEIYARHGFEFSKPENQEYFNQFVWYQELEKTTDMEAVKATFNDAERSNIEKLQAYENAHGWND